MDKHFFPASAAALALLCSCGPKALTLPSDPVDRAATCAVVTAASARTATNVANSLPFESQLNILNYALIAASSGNDFSPDTATAVSRRVAALQDQIVEGKWQDLEPACAAAFPETRKNEVSLPADRFTAQLGCDSLADFIETALRGQTGYANELGAYRVMRNKLNLAMGAEMKRRAGSDITAQRSERHRAIANIVKAGALPAIMKQCLARYG